MMIPQSLLMTVGTAYESSIRDRLRILKDLGTGLDDEDILVLHLLSERKKGADSKSVPCSSARVGSGEGVVSASCGGGDLAVFRLVLPLGRQVIVYRVPSSFPPIFPGRWYPFIKTLPKAFPKVSFASLSSGAAAADGGPSPMDRAEGPIVSLVRERIDTLNRMDKLLSYGNCVCVCVCMTGRWHRARLELPPLSPK